VGGACPDITFVLSGAAVYADKSTKYKGGNCKHFDADEMIAVSGTRESDGRVRADEIDLRKPKK